MRIDKTIYRFRHGRMDKKFAKPHPKTCLNRERRRRLTTRKCHPTLWALQCLRPLDRLLSLPGKTNKTKNSFNLRLIVIESSKSWKPRQVWRGHTFPAVERICQSIDARREPYALKNDEIHSVRTRRRT